MKAVLCHLPSTRRREIYSSLLAKHQADPSLRDLSGEAMGGSTKSTNQLTLENPQNQDRGCLKEFLISPPSVNFYFSVPSGTAKRRCMQFADSV